MKRFLFGVVFLGAVVFLSGCSQENKDMISLKEVDESLGSEKITEDTEAISRSQREFQEGGQAKEAIETESDLWKVYEDEKVGFSFKYPGEYTLLKEGEFNQDLDKVYIKVETKEIGGEQTPMSLSKEEEKRNIEALSAGKFGVESDFPFASSKKVKSIGHIFAQDFLVLSRFEICSTLLERKLLFYFNNKQISITLFGPIESLKKSSPSYFKVDIDNCGEREMWDLDRQEEFYQELLMGNASLEIQKWFDNFDEIAETIIFDHK